MRFKKLMKKWWWLLLLPLLFFIKIGSLFSWKGKDVYTSIAESLYNAMSTFGTKENILFRSVQSLDSGELIKVYNAFGNRGYLNDLGITFPSGAWFGGANLDLFGWFNAELNEVEKTKMRRIWGKSGLNITF